MKTVYVVDAVRTAIGKYGGVLSSIRPDDLLAHVITAIVHRNPGIDVNAIEDVLAGAANQSGEDNRNVARMAGLLAGLPVTVGGNTVNRLCASGLQTIMDGSRTIACGDAELIIACGVESMSRAPFVIAKAGTAFDRTIPMFDTTMGWRFTNKKLAEKYFPYGMGETAENVAKQWKISRQAQDEFAFETQQKYASAWEAGRWKDEIIAIDVPVGKEVHTIQQDEHPRLSTMEKLASLKPAFTKEGTVTAGNSSGINDGAAATLLASEEAVLKYNLKPLARVVSMGVAGVDPAIMGIGPVPATNKALRRAGLSIHELDLVELNEAFASQSLACIQDLELNTAIVNVNGGAIALGHPLGCSGVRITTTLLHEMKRRKSKFGLATMCVGVGQGAAIIYEAL
ncbi:MAG: beta-ketoadipyl CoA thiolase [Niastella sp. SCN 39-18]|nr:acetyl-CoA C-acyltransferase [Sphingobacteriales bacterium]ODT54594.1 MAG: beta-ketoadipyl CoA thiolase [Niastella sp. SCN 39-18]OJW10819.1 MAG: beta-ketoadipyl CoA thiolase [Sphingobacteriales bacterium 39-19]